MVLSLSDRQDRWSCSKRTCREYKPVRADTFLTDSRLEYKKIVLFIYCWSKEYTSVKFCEDELNMNHNTTVDWNMYMREVCEYTLMSNNAVIGGLNTTVEIHESCFSKRKYNRGRFLPNQWVLGGICRETKECFLLPVPNRSARTLLPIILENVAPGTTIITDEWRSYRKLGDTYEHMTVNHSVNFVHPITVAHTNTVESMWCKVKSRNKRQWGTFRPMLNSYLCEYMWRKKYGDDDLFNQMVEHIFLFMSPN